MKLKIAFIFAILFAACDSQQAPLVEDSSSSLAKIYGHLDYVWGDYVGAVQNGKIINEQEYGEQIAKLKRAQDDLAAPDQGLASFSFDKRESLSVDIRHVQDLVDQMANPPEVKAAIHTIMGRLTGEFGLNLVPMHTLQREATQKLFAQRCASCHGADGHADTAIARTAIENKNVPPVNFHDADRMKSVSTTRAYNAISNGIEGTLMAGFSKDLSSDQRWNLAVYVRSLRHLPVAPLPDALKPVVEGFDKIKPLVENADEALQSMIAQKVKEPAQQKHALAYLIAQRPYELKLEPPIKTNTLVTAEKALVKALYFIEHENWAEAEFLIKNDVYNNGIEPIEQHVKPTTKVQLEDAERDLLKAIKAHNLAAAKASCVQLKHAIFIADGELQQMTFTDAFLKALFVTLREGLEIVLLIIALLTFLRKGGYTGRTSSVHVGWMLALFAGVATFLILKIFFFDKIMASARYGELAEGIMTVVAVGLLLFMTHFVFGAKQSKRWVNFLNQRVSAITAKAASAANEPTVQSQSSTWSQKARAILSLDPSLLGLSFFSIYRETLEMIIFYEGILVNGKAGYYVAVLWAIVLGTAIIAVSAFVLSRLGKRFNPKLAMKISSAILGVMCVLMIGQGIHAFQEGSYLWQTPLLIHGHAIRSFPRLGFFANWQAIGAQVIVLLIVILPSLLSWIKARNTAPKTT